VLLLAAERMVMTGSEIIEAGLTLDAISASSMRHVLNGVREIAGAELDL